MGWYDVREGNPLKKSLAEGRTVIGSFIRVAAPEIAEMCAHAGCDFVIVDSEHTPVGWERIAAIITAAENTGTTPILRVSNPTRDLISRGLDAGAHGVMVPQIESAEVAAAAIAATRYGPGGTRGTAGNTRSGFGMKMAYGDHVGAANDAMFVALQVESSAGVDAVGEIVSVEGVDCVFIGLTDLSVNLGHPGEYAHPEVEAAVERIFEAAATRHVPVGVPVPDAAMARAYVARGARFIATGDVGVFARGIAEFVAGARSSSE